MFQFVRLSWLTALLETDLPVVRIDDTGAPDDRYEQFLATGSPARFEHPLDDEEGVISINYTSGRSRTATVHPPSSRESSPT